MRSHGWVTLVFAGLLAWVGVDELRIVVFHGADFGPLFDRGARNAVMGVAALLCLYRAVSRREERAAWGLIGLGLLAWTAGDVYFSIALWDLESVPVPSPADAGYLLLPPCLIAGLALLGRSRTDRLTLTLLADGAGAALAVAAIGAAMVFQPVAGAVEGQALEVSTNLAYPLTDLLLLAGIAGALATRGWALDRTWIALGLGTLAFWGADSLYLVKSANDTATAESWYDFGWTLGIVLFAWAAWQADSGRRVTRNRLRVVIMPLVFSGLALGVIVVGCFTHLDASAVGLAAASLLTVGLRLSAVFREHLTLLAVSRDEAQMDALTGLGNRRALALSIDYALDRSPDDGRQWVLALFDLDGFKHYNDSFGHPAGDALLVRLGKSLADFVGRDGRAFRMGGDEFCALMRVEVGETPAVVARAAIALSERGEGFEIGSSHGCVLLPQEAGTAAEALRIADHRMYSNKRSRRVSAGRQSVDVLLRALAERNPDLSEHVAGVAELAGATASWLGLDEDAVENIVHAAELHDVGKVAIPDAILHKPGPLDESEWEFIRRHTIIGERIIAAAPALAHVARLVRSSHERWDGSGYPDALRGEEIPLGSRIIAVCDAFDAMTTIRPYSTAMDPALAIAELRRCAGGQFDPEVVEAFALAAERQLSTA